MPRETSKCREWEKERRNRLNDAFATLSKVLPCYDPAVNVSKIDILKNAATHIEELQAKLKTLMSESNDDSAKKVKGEEFRKLHDRIRRLLSKNEQLCALLREAKISIPPGCVFVKKFRNPLFWSNRILPEQAKILQKKEAGKENDASVKKQSKFTNKKQNKVGGQNSTPKHRKAILNRSDSRKLRPIKKKKIKPLTPSKCVIVLSQPSVTQSCYVITNAPSNNIVGGTSTVITNSGFVTNPLVSSKANKSVSSVSALGPGTLILANGTIMPVLPQQTVLPLAPQIITRPPIIFLPKTPVTVPCSTVSTSKIVTSGTKTLARIRPKYCSTKTTQVNKVPIPALTSKYSNPEVVLKKSEPKVVKEKKSVAKESNKKEEVPETGEKRKVPLSEEEATEAKKTKVAEESTGDAKEKESTEQEKVPEPEGTANKEKDDEKASEDKTSEKAPQKANEVETKKPEEPIELNINHSELSNDLFASLQVPPGCQNPESTSPTAAFLLAFPLVSTLTGGVKVAEVTEEDNTESQRETPTLLQIGTMDSTKPTQSESLTPSLLNLDNFSFLSSKDIGGFYNSFEGTMVTTTASTVVSTQSVVSKDSSTEKQQQSYQTSQETQQVQQRPPQPQQQVQQLPKQPKKPLQQPRQQPSQSHHQSQPPLQQQQPLQQTQQPLQQPQQPLAQQQTLQQQQQPLPQQNQPLQQPLQQSQQPIQQSQQPIQQSQQPIQQSQQPIQQSQQPIQQSQQPIQQSQQPLQQSQQPLQQSQQPLQQSQQPLQQSQQPLQKPQPSLQQSQQSLQQNQQPLQPVQQQKQPLQQQQPHQKQQQPLQPQQPHQKQQQQPLQQQQQTHHQQTHQQQPHQQQLHQQTQQLHPQPSHQQQHQQTQPQQAQQSQSLQQNQQHRQEKNQLVPCFDNHTFGGTNAQSLNYQPKLGVGNIETKQQPVCGNTYGQKSFTYEPPKGSTTCVYANIKTYPEPLYTNSSTYTYGNTSDTNFNQNYYKEIPKSDNRSYYSLNYENYADYRKNDGNSYFPNSNYYPNTNYSKDKFNNNQNNKKGVQNRPPINWMTAPDNRLQTPADYVLPQFTKETDFYPINTFTNTQTTYFNTNPMYPTNTNEVANQEPRKSLDLSLVPPVNSYQRNEVEDNQLSWSPTKIPQFLDPPHSFATTLPTLVGDLALGNSLSFNEQKDKCPKKDRRLKNYESTNQSNFLSVSQLVDHNKEVPARTTTRRNSGNRSSGKKVQQKSSQRKENKEVYPQANKAEGSSGKGMKQLGYSNSTTDIFCDSSQKNRTVSKNSYSAEALIGHQMQNDTTQKKQQNYNNKTISVSSFLHDNIIPYFPVDLPQDNTYIQQNQNYQTSSFSHNFQSTFQNNTYTANSFIPTTTITSTYNFMHEVTHDYSDLFPPMSKDKNCSKNMNRNVREQQCPTTPKKSSKRKHSNELPGFDFGFLSMPGSINSPILPDDFHTHTGFLQPPTPQLYPCKNPFTKPNDLASLVPLPPVPGTRSSIQHPEISPINSAGTSLTNFNLSTIFPEINNKGGLSDPYSENRVKDNPRSYTTSVQVTFNDKPTFSFSYINCTTSQSYSNQ
ncbi:hypothetical protein Zmor_025619 [Zophobas morio]|uniref:BHLH domain-containing protein n=1 Tax=Zophobas morio TaxID=2755281 RepID=A0AA38HS98_9CUCU|nr:hypothetical protein Zmor_025619 [Zophobas morio]